KKYTREVAKKCEGMSYTQRVILHAKELKKVLPADYDHAITILGQILGEENPKEIGMFTNYYWLLPVGKYVELYGLDNFDTSISAIAEITKRNTGEYCIRPFIRKYPEKTLAQMKAWARSSNFHLRRLASEGLRPKLPWAPKLDVFVENPQPVFEILELLKEDEIKFVQRSVANHLTDYLKVNPAPTLRLLSAWKKSDHPSTKWIIKHATRKDNYDF
ncbi:MAG: DNA alkylation repair protein, partial [Owenweeksia sp.]